eukprot:TRINITY_DN51911_c0_g1_i1.p2 TRINITY_DN51911_c0_g1~~TRINITY_DN51911_c0_g1_i1.p2  ORF type:complete len:367 (+),score=135.99 TRINITY_DN51911_c0_g1_i1:80-1102(+)
MAVHFDLSAAGQENDPALRGGRPTMPLALQLQVTREELIQLVRDTLPSNAHGGVGPAGLQGTRGPLLSMDEFKEQCLGRLIRVVVRKPGTATSEGRVCVIVGLEEREESRYRLDPELETAWWLLIEHAGRRTSTKITLVNGRLFSAKEVQTWAASATAPSASACQRRWQEARTARLKRKAIMSGKEPWPKITVTPLPLLPPTSSQRDEGGVQIDGKPIRGVLEMGQPDLVRLIKRCQGLSRSMDTGWFERWDALCDEHYGVNQRDPSRKTKEFLLAALQELGDPVLKGPPPDPKGAGFSPCPDFRGPLPGYYFAQESAGLGYYKDWRQQQPGPDAKRPRF